MDNMLGQIKDIDEPRDVIMFDHVQKHGSKGGVI
jgi:hypothetical protein